MGLCLTINEFVCSQNYFPKQFCSNKNILDIRTQLNEQLRCLDTRLECQQSQLLEIQDVFKRRAEIELNYSRDLEKLSKLLTSRHKEQKLKNLRDGGVHVSR